MKYGLKDSIVQDLQSIFAAFSHVQQVVLNGSRTLGNYKQGSDIDLTFKGLNLNIAQLNKIALKINELFTPFIFDLSVYHQINNSYLIEHIKRVGVDIYCKKEV